MKYLAHKPQENIRSRKRNIKSRKGKGKKIDQKGGAADVSVEFLYEFQASSRNHESSIESVEDDSESKKVRLEESLWEEAVACSSMSRESFRFNMGFFLAEGE